jgi:sugar transferase (PEP-CTERM system associated)
MIRLFNVYFPGRTLLLAVTEAALIVLALAGGVALRYGSDFVFVMSYEGLWSKICVAMGVFMLCMYYYDLYDSNSLNSPREVWTRLVQVLGTACVLLGVVYYSAPGLRMGRGELVLGLALVGFIIAAWRKLFFVLNRSSRLNEHAIVLGRGPLVKLLAREFESRPELGVHLAGYVGPPEAEANGLHYLGGLDQVDQVVNPRRINRVIVTMSDRRGNLPVESLLRLKTQGVVVQDGADLYEAVAGRLPLDSLRPGRLLFSTGFRISRGVLVYKRISNFVLSLIGLVVLSPILVLVAVAIKLDSRGPVLYRQQRVGQKGHIFEILKFRSMRVDAEVHSGPVWAVDNDPRITRVGRVIRKLRLDELPQLINLLRGDMNFVGPRPERPYFVEMLREQIPFYDMRHTVRPGITGWAQICCSYGSTVEENRAKLEYDLFYIKNLSASFDLLILFETAKVMLLGRGAK